MKHFCRACGRDVQKHGTTTRNCFFTVCRWNEFNQSFKGVKLCLYINLNNLQYQGKTRQLNENLYEAVVKWTKTENPSIIPKVRLSFRFLMVLKTKIISYQAPNWHIEVPMYVVFIIDLIKIRIFSRNTSWVQNLTQQFFKGKIPYRIFPFKILALLPRY